MNSIEALARTLGAQSMDMVSIWNEVKANHALLESCKMHKFESLEANRLGARYVCRVCGGTADAVAVTWYHRGITHASNSVTT